MGRPAEEGVLHLSRLPYQSQAASTTLADDRRFASQARGFIMTSEEEHMWKVMEFFIGPEIVVALHRAEEILSEDPKYKKPWEKNRQRLIEDSKKIKLD